MRGLRKASSKEGFIELDLENDLMILIAFSHAFSTTIEDKIGKEGTKMC